MDDGYRDYEEVMDILSSSEKYMEFIKNSDEPGALEFASEFLSLNEEDQNLFLKAMQPENFIQLLDLMDHEPGTRGTVNFDGVEVPFAVVDDETAMLFSTTPIVIGVTDNESLMQARRELNFSRTHTISVAGIVNTSFTGQLFFNVNSNNRPTSTTHFSSSHLNWNPGLWINYNYVHHRMSNNMATGYGSYRVNLTAAVGAISKTVRVELRRNGTVNQSRLWCSLGNWTGAWR